MEAWVEEAVNESSKAIDWLYSDSFAFSLFVRGLSPQLGKSRQMTIEVGVCLFQREAKSLIGKEILHSSPLRNPRPVLSKRKHSSFNHCNRTTHSHHKLIFHFSFLWETTTQAHISQSPQQHLGTSSTFVHTSPVTIHYHGPPNPTNLNRSTQKNPT